MKRTIEGRRFDTQTAEEIASWDNGHYGGDFNRQQETLYKSPKGQYFVHGEGGALSAYAESHGNSRCGGESLWLVDEDQAFKWLLDHGLDSTAEEVFPQRVEEG